MWRREGNQRPRAANDAQVGVHKKTLSSSSQASRFLEHCRRADHRPDHSRKPRLHLVHRAPRLLQHGFQVEEGEGFVGEDSAALGLIGGCLEL